MNYTEIIDLDSETTENMAEVYEGYARHLSKQDDAQTPLIPSCYLIAASLKSLIQPGAAIPLFQMAADYYREQENPFWKIVAICGLQDAMLRESGFRNEVVPGDAENVFGEMLGQFFTTQGRNSLFKINESDGSSPVGRLGIPLYSYFSALREAAELGRGSPIQSTQTTNLGYLLNRAAEQTRGLQADHYHWRRLKGNFLPLEPELLATCIILVKLLNEASVRVGEFVEKLGLDKVAKLPLMVAKALLNESDLPERSEGRQNG